MSNPGSPVCNTGRDSSDEEGVRPRVLRAGQPVSRFNRYHSERNHLCPMAPSGFKPASSRVAVTARLRSGGGPIFAAAKLRCASLNHGPSEQDPQIWFCFAVNCRLDRL